MRKFLRFSLVALFAVLGMSNAMAEDIIWQEDWTGWTAKIVPTADEKCPDNYSFVGTVTNTDGSFKSGTTIFDESLAGGTAPELMIAKSAGSFTATVSLGGKTGDFILTFLTNRNDLKVEVTGGTLGDKKRSGNSDSYAITDVTETSLTIKFYMTSNSNARLDNIKLYQGTAKQNPGLSWGKASASVEFENEDDYEKYLPKLQNPNELTLSCTSSDETVATVTNDGTISVHAAGKTTLTASFEGNDDYEAQTVTCELTVTVKKADAELAFSEEEVTVTLGDDFTAPTLTNPHAVEVVYSSSKTEVAEVDATTGEVTIKAAGTTKITAKVPSTNEEYDGSASYTINVNEAAGTDISNTPETAYTVAKAYELIDAGEGLDTEVYVTGKISKIDKFDDTDKYITYWISDDGTTTKQFECYKGKGLNGADFAAATDLKVGATVIVKGKMKKYNTIYEFDAGNVLVSYDESTAGGDPEEIDATIAGLYSYTAATSNIKLTINNGKVVYVDGKSVYVRDGEKAILFYDCGLTLPVNATVSGTVSVDLDIYKGLHEVKKNSKTSADNLTITESSEEAAPVEATFDKLASKDYTNDLIIIKNQSVIEDDGKWYIQNGDAKIQLFKKNADYSSYVSDTKKYDIIAIATVYNSNAQLTPISFSETTGIQNLTIDADANAPMYNLKGERVDANYRGVVIKAGKKTIQK